MHTKSKLIVVVILVTLALATGAQALTGVYVINTTKNGPGCVLSFTANGRFTTVVYKPGDKQRYYGKGKYTISGNMLTMTTPNGATATVRIERNGDLYDKENNLRLHRYMVLKK